MRKVKSHQSFNSAFRSRDSSSTFIRFMVMERQTQQAESERQKYRQYIYAIARFIDLELVQAGVELDKGKSRMT